MRVTNGRFQQTGRNDGKPLGFLGIGAACDPTNDMDCLANLDSSAFNTPLGTNVDALVSTTYYPSGLQFNNSGGVTLGSKTPTAKSNSSNMTMLVMVMAGAALLFAMKK